MASYTFTIDSDFDQVPDLGARLRASCEAMGLQSGDAIEIEICVVEAVNNVIEHGLNRRAGHPIEVTARLDGSTFITEVHDTGKAIPRERLEAKDVEPDPDDVLSLSERGRGLATMRAVMDDVSYASRNGHNTLTLSKHVVPVR